MALKRTRENLDGLHDEVAKLYTERDGKFFLDVEESGDIASLKKSLQAERTVSGNLKKERDSFEADLKKTQAELETTKGLVDSKTKEQVEVKIAEMRESLTGQFAEKEKALAAERDSLRKGWDDERRNTAVLDAIGKHDGRPQLLRTLVESRTEIQLDSAGNRVIRVLGEDGNAMLSADSPGEYMTVNEYVATLKADKAYGGAFNGKNASGGGTHTPSDDPNKVDFGAVRHRGDLNGPEAEAAFIGDKGQEAFLKLPPAPAEK